MGEVGDVGDMSSVPCNFGIIYHISRCELVGGLFYNCKSVIVSI